METWTIESHPGKQTLLAWIITIVGLVMAFGFQNFDGWGFTNGFAGFSLGILLLVIGATTLVVGGRRTVSIDSKIRRILIEDEYRFGKKEQLISFDEIDHVCVGRLGDKESGSIAYDVVLRLKVGKNVSLFRPAYFEGTWNRSVMEGRCRRLEEYLQASLGL